MSDCWENQGLSFSILPANPFLLCTLTRVLFLFFYSLQNIVSLLGICTMSEPMLLIVEFMSDGSLKVA
jgi:hypothetical protein